MLDVHTAVGRGRLQTMVSSARGEEELFEDDVVRALVLKAVPRYRVLWPQSQINRCAGVVSQEVDPRATEDPAVLGREQAALRPCPLPLQRQLRRLRGKRPFDITRAIARIVLVKPLRVLGKHGRLRQSR